LRKLVDNQWRGDTRMVDLDDFRDGSNTAHLFKLVLEQVHVRCNRCEAT
jgi:hypothetical protein